MVEEKMDDFDSVITLLVEKFEAGKDVRDDLAACELDEFALHDWCSEFLSCEEIFLIHDINETFYVGQDLWDDLDIEDVESLTALEFLSKRLGDVFDDNAPSVHFLERGSSIISASCSLQPGGGVFSDLRIYRSVDELCAEIVSMGYVFEPTKDISPPSDQIEALFEDLKQRLQRLEGLKSLENLDGEDGAIEMS